VKAAANEDLLVAEAFTEVDKIAAIALPRFAEN
jgi:hypothetical protein